MAILVKTGEGNISFMGKDLLLATIHLPWFFIHVIIIPLNLHIVMNGLPFSVIFILMHNDNNWASL